MSYISAIIQYITSWFTDTTILHKAVQTNDIDQVKNLISKNYNLNQQDPSGNAPLFYAIQNGNADMVNLLVQNGADLNVQDIEGKTYLHKISDPVLAQILVKNGAHTDIKDGYGRTCLEYDNGYYRLSKISDGQSLEEEIELSGEIIFEKFSDIIGNF
ncbi:MAG: ankyrin repeat domain-containing protein [Rickettsiaceae bacterium]|nr:ankyrin repeat domain-containing protein [Rickettsiaceae bacterium]